MITWGLTVTRGTRKERLNLGIYRQQLIGRNRLIMRWLAHRGGALDYQDWCAAHPGEPFPVTVVLGADPATLLAAVTPVPDTLSEYAFAGLLRGARTVLVEARGGLPVPASAEIVLEGAITPGDEAPEGPFGDHTGYYNEIERFPVFTVQRMSWRDDAIYHSTYTGRPPGRAGGTGRGVERSVRADPAKAVPGDRGLLPAAGGVLVPARRRQHPQAVRRARAPGDAGGVVVPAPVYIYQDGDRHRRRHRCRATGRTSCGHWPPAWIRVATP